MEGDDKMRNLIVILFGLGLLYCMAYLPSFIFFVFVGQYIQPAMGVSQGTFFIGLNVMFVVIFLSYVFLIHKQRYH